MKKIILLVVVLCFTKISNAQFNSKAPWMKNLLEQKKSLKDGNPIKFKEIVNAFDEYWKDKDQTKKGSGYKPFMRWADYWKNCLNDDGTLMAPYQQWNAVASEELAKSNMVDESNWIALGPTDFIDRPFNALNIGRINVIAIDPNNANVYFAGTPAGGIWKSPDGGLSWAPLSDELPQIGVSAIAIDANNSDTIYIGTGDDDANDTYSVGLLKSTDGGQTWNTTGLTFTSTSQNINEVYIDPTDSTKIFVSSSNGFYKSTDSGATFSNTLSGDLNDMKLKPGDSNIIYAVTDSRVYKSINAGDSFTEVTFGVPASSTRLVIEVTPANPSYVYLLSAGVGSAFQGLYKSTNSGNTFDKTANTADIFDSTQAWYDLALTVSDTNADEIYVGVLDIFKSTNGGDSFTRINDWGTRNASYTHADIHFLRFFNGELYCGSDGGIFKSSNGGANFTDFTKGMQIGQFYRLSVSKTNGKSNKMAGGLQDNGSYGLTNSGEWNVYGGGDGMDAAIDPANDNNYYGFMQNGENLWISTNGGQSRTSSVRQPSGSSGNWITPLKMNSASELYAAYQAIYRLDGNSFTKVSANIGGAIDVLEIDPSNDDLMYVGVNNQLSKSTDRGVTFSLLEAFSGNVSSIAIHSSDSNIMYVTTSGTSGGVFKSINGGQDFTAITGNLPSVPKLVIKHQGLHSDNPLYVGTSIGVYRIDDTSGGVWEVFDNNLPNSPIRDLEINVNDANITAATYGRGIWQSQIPVKLAQDDARLLSINNVSPIGIVCGDVTPSITVKNNGLNEITSMDIQYAIGGVSNTITWTGTIASAAEASIDLPQTVIELGQVDIDVTISLVNDANTGNDSLNLTFSKNNSGTTDVNDLEDASDDMLVVGGVWERGVPTGTLLNSTASGQNVYGTNLDGNYSDESRNYLVSNCYDLSAIDSPVLKFNMAFDIELDWDFVNVEYTIDGGSNWLILGTANDSNWYNSNTLPSTNCFNCPGAQWTGTDATMKEYTYNLDAFTNESSFLFRFNFVTDQAENQEGVIIDDIIIGNLTLGTEEFKEAVGFRLYPNPSSDIFNIQWKNASEVSYSLYDVTGKMILNENDINGAKGATSVDASSFSKGVYFLEVTIDGTKKTMKLIRK